ncbi:MAG TPA: CoA transferase [Acidimicrobiia bacterium]|nr:CoA transferase [Acidimicrobiia bacterium]
MTPQPPGPGPGAAPSGGPPPRALEGLKVVDAATLLAGPLVATLLGDYGADVVKVEHPAGDALRGFGWVKDGVSLWWLFINRNKACVSLKLSDPAGAALLKELVSDADVLVENFRPGTLERWGLGWDVLHELNPRLVMVRVTGFGQTGPYAARPGYGTLAESMSGFAHLNGYPDGPPTLPPLALADGVAGCVGAFATLAALRHRDVTGLGQVVDQAIYEPLFWIFGAQALAYDQLGLVPGRTGNRTPMTVPRNSFQAADGQWFGLSGASQSVAERVVRLVGRDDLVAEDWFADHTGRLAHQDEVEDAIAAWVAKRRSEEVTAAFEAVGAAIAPMYSIADIMADPHYADRQAIQTVDDETLGPVRVPGVVARLCATPGAVRHLGRAPGADNQAIFGRQLGHSTGEIDRWRAAGII